MKFLKLQNSHHFTVEQRCHIIAVLSIVPSGIRSYGRIAFEVCSYWVIPVAHQLNS
jgi:hypothetical protein